MDISELYDIFRSHSLITTDSRDVPEDSIFFALKGETFDGNKYAVASLEKGAAYAVIDDKDVYNKAEESLKSRLLLTEDVLSTLQKLANYHRQELGTTIIGVTGTNGKTTTKELIAAVLRKKYNVLYTQGNFNNHIGVPKTLLQLTKEHEMAVIEMGANHPGEIKTLVNIVEPDFGIITNVGKAHLLGFGSFEGVIHTKGELYDYLRENAGKVFINNDNEHLKGICEGLELIKYGCNEENELMVKGEFIECNPFLKFKWNGNDVQTNLIGSYNIDNALAAATIGSYFGIDEQSISEALSQYIPTNNRSQMKHTECNDLIIDAYNANPTSMAAAIDNFKVVKAEHKMCILGAMKELGNASDKEHASIVSKVKECGFEKIWFVGSEFGTAMTHADVQSVNADIQQGKPKGYTILIKGSNSTKLIETVEYL